MRTAFFYPAFLGLVLFVLTLALQVWQLIIPAAILFSLGKAMHDQPEMFEKRFPFLSRI